MIVNLLLGEKIKNKKLFLLALNCPLIALPFVAISCGNNGSSNKSVKPSNPSNPTNQAKNKYQKLEDAFATIESIDPSIKDIYAMNADESTFKLIKLKASEGTVNIINEVIHIQQIQVESYHILSRLMAKHLNLNESKLKDSNLQENT